MKRILIMAVALFATTTFATNHTVRVTCGTSVGTNTLSGLTIPARSSLQFTLNDLSFTKSKGLQMYVQCAFGSTNFTFGPFHCAPVTYTGYLMRFVKPGTQVVSGWVPAGSASTINIKQYMATYFPGQTYPWFGIEFTNDTATATSGDPTQPAFSFTRLMDYDGNNAHTFNVYNTSGSIMENYWKSSEHSNGFDPIPLSGSLIVYVEDITYGATPTAGISAQAVSLQHGNSTYATTFSGPFYLEPTVVVTTTPAVGPIVVTDGETTISINNPTTKANENVTVSVTAQDY